MSEEFSLAGVTFRSVDRLPPTLPATFPELGALALIAPGPCEACSATTTAAYGGLRLCQPCASDEVPTRRRLWLKLFLWIATRDDRNPALEAEVHQLISALRDDVGEPAASELCQRWLREWEAGATPGED